MSCPSGNKRQRSEEPCAEDFLKLGRDIWSKDPVKSKAFATENRKFREFFGCGPNIACGVWNLVVSHNLLPDNGTMEHFMWTLLYLKVYAKENTMSALIDGKPDPKTIQKWVWQFITSISLLEPELVSSAL